MRGIPERVPDSDVAQIWSEIATINPDHGVIAPYELTAPLSSRRLLYSYVMDVNKPKGWPNQIPDTIRHVFIARAMFPEANWQNQGFTKVWTGRSFELWQR
jgi:hypothetical protein